MGAVISSAVMVVGVTSAVMVAESTPSAALRAVVIAASVLAGLAVLKWVWSAVLRQMAVVISGVVKADLDAIRQQFSNNGGSTTRDAIDRIESKLDDLGDEVRSHGTRLSRLETPQGDT